MEYIYLSHVMLTDKKKKQWSWIDSNDQNRICHRL